MSLALPIENNKTEKLQLIGRGLFIVVISLVLLDCSWQIFFSVSIAIIVPFAHSQTSVAGNVQTNIDVNIYPLSCVSVFLCKYQYISHTTADNTVTNYSCIHFLL